jgi:cell division protein FtsQ
MGRPRASTSAGRTRSTAGKARPGQRRGGAKRAAGAAATGKRAKPKAPPPRRPPRRRSPGRSQSRPRRSPRARSAPRSRRPLRWRYRIAIAIVALVALGCGYLFWFRDSSLVAVSDVEVVGVTGPEREQIVAELTRVGERMTTLHADREQIERAATRFATVESVSVDPNFPHGLRIEIVERPPRLIASAGGEQVPIAADGTVLAGVAAPEDGLPVLEVEQVPASGSLTGEPLEQALVLGAAPAPLRPLIEDVKLGDDYGVEVTLRGEIPVRFGTGDRVAEKWSAAAAVLADPKLTTATYVDVRVPERPAVGGAATSAPAADPPA